MRLSISLDGKTTKTVCLGPDLEKDQRPQIIVPKGAWQSAMSEGEWTLMGCIVSPAFSVFGF